MFKTFFFREVSSGLKSPMVYIFFVITGLFCFIAVTSPNVQIGGSIGNVNVNAPHIITTFTSIMSLFGLIFAAAFFNNAALRDYNYQFNEILFSTPLSKSGYFFGRFFGALLLACIPLLGVFFGILLGTFFGLQAGWVEADQVGSFYGETFINNFFLYILPNMFFAGAITYTLANKYRSTVISFMGVIAVIVGYSIAGTLLSDLENESIAAMVDPFGTTAYNVATKYWTPAEKNTLSPQFEGLLLQNRLLYMAVSAVVLALAYFSFSFSEKKKRKSKKVVTADSSVTDVPRPAVNPVFNGRTAWLQFKSIYKVDFRSIVKSVTFKVIFVFMLALTFGNLSGGFEYFGLQSYPVTYKMLDVISAISILFVLIILVFFSGELVWRDRDNKINEVIDASPHSSLPSLLAKGAALFSVALCLHVFVVGLAMLFQLLDGYTNLEPGVYFKSFFYQQFSFYFILCTFNIFLQVIINNKYIAYFVAVLYLLLGDLLFLVLDVSTNLVFLGATPTVIYSDMNEFGPAAEGAMVFNLYWIILSVLFLLVTSLFVKRGLISGRKERWKVAGKSMTGPSILRLGVTTVLWLGMLGYIVYNTFIINEIPDGDAREEAAANYEKKFKKYEKVPQPKLLAANYNIDIFPEDRDVKAKIEVSLVNQTDVAIDSLHFTINEDWNHQLEIPGAEMVFHDKETGYQIYSLSEPMQAGDTLDMEVLAEYITRGFENEVTNSSVIRNGTFFNNLSIMPGFGYSTNYELGDNDTRAEYDLPRKDRVPKLVEDCGPLCDINYLTDGKSDYINVETVISTSADQIAVAPGSLVEEWEKDGRKYFRYKVDHPSLNFYSFISARFEVARRKWNGVDIEIYYDAKHPYNIDKMLDAVERSLIYYTENFGPYYHKQARIIEFPRYATFAQAFPGTMPYSEAFGFIINLEDEGDNNVVGAVIAHEMAHQWWAHQEISANMQGGTMLTESFAEYSALMVMKKDIGAFATKDFLKYDLDRYLVGRSQETVKELPLYKVENQGYIHYGKGSVVLYALQDYIGEEKVNRALRNFLDEFKYSTPYPTSLDFLEYLEPEVPDSLQYLLDDWFREITLYDNRLKEAKVEDLENGRYRVTMDIETYKLKADTLGAETRVPMNDWVDVGLYADAEETDLIMEKRVKFDSTSVSFSFEVDQKPVKAAIDPRRILIERVYSDNVKRLEEQE